MINKCLTALLAFCLLALPLRVSATSNPIYAFSHKTTHVIEETTIVGNALCSATAIGPHALLTATHCELGTDEVSVDDKDPVKIIGIVRDGMDHTIYTVDMTFADYTTVSFRSPEVGEDVYMFGNPKGIEDVFRKGY